MPIEELVASVPPPDDPVDGTGDWAIAESEFGVAFPDDFKELIRVYGTGRFYGDLRIANPLKAWGRDLIRDDLERYRELRGACEYSLSLFPERPGLLPWGEDSNGNLFCWWTDGPPDSWTVAQLGHGEEETPHHASVPITTFLVRFLKNEYPAMLGGQMFSEARHHFEPGIPWISPDQA